ncbi:hypothetical protein TNCV_4904321 [Trichonephila clavipes]|nr:hypothetical protein TNCV_4904321 [Trichonephila clavipes]
MTEQNLMEHVVKLLEHQVLDYVEVRNPTTRSQLLQVVSNFEERYWTIENQDLSNNIKRRYIYWDACLRSPDDNRNGNTPQRNNVNQGFKNKNRNVTKIIMDSRMEVVGICLEIGVRVKCFNLGDQRHGGRLNCLRVRVYHDDQSHIEVNHHITIAARRMTSVKLPYVPFLIKKHLHKRYGTLGQESRLSLNTYTKNVFYKPLKKSHAEVMTAHGPFVKI